MNGIKGYISIYDLHIRTAAGESAAHLSLHHDRHCCAHGLWKDYGGKLVSGRARQSGGVTYHSHQRITKCDPILSKLHEDNIMGKPSDNRFIKTLGL